MHTSSSNPNLLTQHESERLRPTSMPEHWLTGSAIPASDAASTDIKLRQDFLGVAKNGKVLYVL